MIPVLFSSHRYQSVSIEEDLITSLDDIIHLGERSTLYINATETKIHSIHVRSLCGVDVLELHD